MGHLQRSLLLGAVLLGLGTADAQTPARPVGRDLQVELVSAVKARKAKVGDVVTAVTDVPLTLPKGLVVPAGSRVVGHVRRLDADSGDAHTSFIALSFDEIEIKKGQTVPLNCFVRAALLPAIKGTTAQASQQGQNLPPMQAPTRDGGMSSGGMMPNSGTNMGNPNPGDLVSPTGQPQEGAKPVAAHTGEVVGMRGVELQVTNPDHLSVFRSARKNLELDEGLELMLVVLQ
jgi:hypothetical protein